jgi:hypothetical protein
MNVASRASVGTNSAVLCPVFRPGNKKSRRVVRLDSQTRLPYNVSPLIAKIIPRWAWPSSGSSTAQAQLVAQQHETAGSRLPSCQRFVAQ